MGPWNWINRMLDYGYGVAADCSPPQADSNPATGLPMIGGIGGIDVHGNPFGHDLHCWHESSTAGASCAGDTLVSTGCSSAVSDAWSQSSWSGWDH